VRPVRTASACEGRPPIRAMQFSCPWTPSYATARLLFCIPRPRHHSAPGPQTHRQDSHNFPRSHRSDKSSGLTSSACRKCFTASLCSSALAGLPQRIRSPQDDLQPLCALERAGRLVECVAGPCDPPEQAALDSSHVKIHRQPIFSTCMIPLRCAGHPYAWGPAGSQANAEQSSPTARH
jgi:hypothetical protein